MATKSWPRGGVGYQRRLRNLALYNAVQVVYKSRPMPLEQKKKTEIISKFKTTAKDTGSPEVQIALISERITSLSKHFDSHKKDNSSRLGLLKLVGQRRKLLSYLKTSDKNRYTKVIGTLGLRK